MNWKLCVISVTLGPSLTFAQSIEQRCEDVIRSANTLSFPSPLEALIHPEYLSQIEHCVELENKALRNSGIDSDYFSSEHDDSTYRDISDDNRTTEKFSLDGSRIEYSQQGSRVDDGAKSEVTTQSALPGFGVVSGDTSR